MVSKLFVFLGICFLAFAVYLVWERNNPQRLSFNTLTGTEKQSAHTAAIPIRLSIPSQHIDLPIFPTTITKTVWGDTKQGVSYLTSSPIPGTIGNSIIYGHNWPNLLGPLTKVKPGEKITVRFADGQKVIFTVKFTSIVTPDQTHVLEKTDDARLTLYTCTGFFDSKRFVVTAIKD